MVVDKTHRFSSGWRLAVGGYLHVMPRAVADCATRNSHGRNSIIAGKKITQGYAGRAEEIE